MPALQCEAIVLRSVDFGESDRIVHLLTQSSGRLAAMAKGARRSQRRFPGTLDVFNLLKVEGRLKPRTSMAFLERAELIDPHLGLRQSPARYALASFLVEMLDRLSPEGIAGSEAARLFDFARESLALLTEVPPDATLRVLLELRALDALGLRPELGRCVRCGRVPAEDVSPHHRVGFHVPDGGIVCSACGLPLEGLVPLEMGTLRLLDQGLRAHVSGLAAIGLGADALRQAERLAFRFQRFHVGVELRSERFLNEVIPMGPPGPA